jgi:hypothetical protein
MVSLSKGWFFSGNGFKSLFLGLFWWWVVRWWVLAGERPKRVIHAAASMNDSLMQVFKIHIITYQLKRGKCPQRPP